MAENMIQRRDEIVKRLADAVGEQRAAMEVDLSIQRIFTYAAWPINTMDCAPSAGTQYHHRHARAGGRHRHSCAG